jgi:Recombinase
LPAGTGEVEIEKEQALVVQRIFELYSEGMSPRNIAARLNAESVPSPGAQWRRRSIRKRMAHIQREISNLADAIASGALRGSPALAERLRAAESELASLGELRVMKRPPSLVMPDVRGRYLEMLHGLDGILERDPERGREELRRILGDRIKLRPDKTGSLLWAEYSLGMSALLPSQSNADTLVAGAGFITHRLSLAA